MTDRPTLERFVLHGRRFGPECVIDTARVHLSGRQLVALEAELAQLDRRPRTRRRGGRR